MAAQQQQPPKQQLVQGLPGMFPDKTPAWRALAALAIGQLHDDVAAGLVSFDAEDKRATIEAAVAGTAGAGPAAAGAAAGPRIPQTFQGFQELLDGPLDEQVLRRAFELLPAQVQLAHTKQQAQWVYNRALQLPGSSTKLFAQQHGGMLINGDFLPNVVSRSALVYAFKNRVPVLLKIPSREGAKHEADVWKALTETCSQPPGLAGPIKLLTLKGSAGQVGRLGLQMPLYPATLQHMPKPLPAQDVLAIGHEVLQGLKHMHQCGWAHCDVKAPNIFVDADGSAVLGDYGAARRLGDDADEKTLSHIACDLPAAFQVDKASEELDRYLLAVTLLERLGLLQLGSRVLTIAAVRQAAGKVTADGDLQGFISSLLGAIVHESG